MVPGTRWDFNFVPYRSVWAVRTSLPAYRHADHPLLVRFLLVRGRVVELAGRDTATVEDDQATGIDVEGDGRGEREERRKRAGGMRLCVSRPNRCMGGQQSSPGGT
ncbi:hypothetical protein GW17_00002178 [Ensete ventricosum]|nr:hypothetical protein GW17_00002178 [Ensete ventricosum]